MLHSVFVLSKVDKRDFLEFTEIVGILLVWLVLEYWETFTFKKLGKKDFRLISIASSFD